MNPKLNNTNITSNQLKQGAHNYSFIQKNQYKHEINIENIASHRNTNGNLAEINAALAFIKRQNMDIFNQNDQIL